MNNTLDVRDRIALVTGGGTGVGRAIATAFLAAGAKRVYIVSRKAAVLEQTAAELDPDGRCIALPADLSSVEACRHLAGEIGERETSLNILVNNSGISWIAPFADYPEKGWDKTFQINLKAPFFLTQALIELLAAGASPDAPASVINVGSIAGEMSKGGGAYAYGLSKSALHHATRMLALELGPRNITVNAIAPGRFETDMTTLIQADRKRYESEAALIPARPLGKVGATGRDGCLPRFTSRFLCHGGDDSRGWRPVAATSPDTRTGVGQPCADFVPL